MAAASMLHATRRRTPPLSAALATAFFAPKPQPPPLVLPRLVDAAVSRCPSDALALSFFLWCARRPAYFHPPASFDRILPAATRLASRLRTAPALLRELRAVGCPIRPHTFMLLLRLYWRGGLYPLVLQLFDQMPLWGFHPSVFALNIALDVHLRTGRLDAALRLLQERDKPSPNYLTYAISVTHLSRAGDWSGVRNCFIFMLQQGFLPSAASLASVFACCSKAGTMSELLQLLSFTLVSGYQLNSVMWTCFIARICREGRLDEACRMLAKMLDSGSSPTVVTYTPLVKGLFRAGRHDKVHELLGSMASTGCSPDLVFYNVLMDCMMKERRYDYALYIYLNLHRSGIKPDAYTLSTLVQVLQLSHNMVLLPRLIPSTGISYDLVACNSMLSALSKSGFPSEAIQFYIDMVDVGFRPDSYSYVRCLNSLCQLGRIDHAKSFYHSIVDPNTYVHASILRGLVRSGKNRMALKIFGEAVRQNYALDAVCYTIVLHGLFQAHLVEEACKLFDKMKLLGMASNTCIYNVMLRGLYRTRDMHAVTQLLGEMECAGVQMDSISFNILVVLLIKLQRISSATTLVREMLNLGMKLSTKTHWLLSQSIGHAFNVDDATVAEIDASDSTYIPQIVKKNSVTAETSSSDASAEQLRLRRVLPKDHLVPGDILFLPVNIQESSVAAKTKKFGDRNEIDFLRSIEIYKDEAIIVVNKPPGMPVQGGVGIKNSIDVLAPMFEETSSEVPRLVHRLDRDCSGVLVLGRTQFSASILHAIFRDKTADALADDKGTQQVLQRKYVALVIGTPRHPKGLLSAPLAKVVLQDGKSERLTVRAGSNTTFVQDALTEYRVIESCPQGYTWLELFPLTGRKHQLRVHCAEVLGTPIVGDYKYGRQAHQNWMPLPLPQTVDEELLKKRRLPFGLALGGGSIAEEQPQLHLHCKQMILPDISAAVHRLQSADVDFSDLEKLSFVAPLPLHMRLSWEVFKSLANK